MNASLLGIETAEIANPVGGSTEDPTTLAEREVAEAEELLQQWEAVAHMRLALNDDLFQAAGGAAKLEEELGEELGVRGRVQVVDVEKRQGSNYTPVTNQHTYLTFVIRPATGPMEPTPAAAMASLEKLWRAPSASFRRTQLLSRINGTTDGLMISGQHYGSGYLCRGYQPSSFDLTVQPAIGGEQAAITLEGIRSNMSVSDLRDRVHAEMESKPQPDEQRLFIVDGDKGPLEDETLPIGAYGVVSGVTLHLAMRDGQSAVRRREARSQVRARLRAEAKEAERARERARYEQRERERACEKAANVFITWVAATLVTLLITSPGAYFSRGCGACKNDAACGGSLWGECVCTGNHLGTYCEHSCGEFGQVDGSTCVCSDNHTGTFCELDASGIKYGEESEEESVPSSRLVTTCVVLAIAGGCIIACGYLQEDWNASRCAGLVFYLFFLPAGCCVLCVAGVVLLVAAL